MRDSQPSGESADPRTSAGVPEPIRWPPTGTLILDMGSETVAAEGYRSAGVQLRARPAKRRLREGD